MAGCAGSYPPTYPDVRLLNADAVTIAQKTRRMTVVVPNTSEDAPDTGRRAGYRRRRVATKGRSGKYRERKKRPILTIGRWNFLRSWC